MDALAEDSGVAAVQGVMGMEGWGKIGKEGEQGWWTGGRGSASDPGGRDPSPTVESALQDLAIVGREEGEGGGSLLEGSSSKGVECGTGGEWGSSAAAGGMAVSRAVTAGRWSCCLQQRWLVCGRGDQGQEGVAAAVAQLMAVRAEQGRRRAGGGGERAAEVLRATGAGMGVVGADLPAMLMLGEGDVNAGFMAVMGECNSLSAEGEGRREEEGGGGPPLVAEPLVSASDSSRAA